MKSELLAGEPAVEKVILCGTPDVVFVQVTVAPCVTVSDPGLNA
ncbi:MAG TPA: hypothetical protein VNU46_06675 [Gemmatimonadaceae bacterium]|nr:hypothetical protein [Gemmatimonadaceae bacterium]